MKNYITIITILFCISFRLYGDNIQTNPDHKSDLTELEKEYSALKEKLSEYKSKLEKLDPEKTSVKKIFEIRSAIQKLMKQLDELDKRRKLLEKLLSSSQLEPIKFSPSKFEESFIAGVSDPVKFNVNISVPDSDFQVKWILKDPDGNEADMDLLIYRNGEKPESPLKLEFPVDKMKPGKYVFEISEQLIDTPDISVNGKIEFIVRPDIRGIFAAATNIERGKNHKSILNPEDKNYLYVYYQAYGNSLREISDSVFIVLKNTGTGKTLLAKTLSAKRNPDSRIQISGIPLRPKLLPTGTRIEFAAVVKNVNGQTKSDIKFFQVKTIAKVQKEEKPQNENNQENDDVPVANTEQEEDFRGKESKSLTEEIKSKEIQKMSITLSPSTVKPGGFAKFKINLPPQFPNPKITAFTCSSNLIANWSKSSMTGTLIADTVTAREEKAYITATVIDKTTGKFVTAKAVLIISTSDEYKLGLKLQTRMIKGKTYNFKIQVPSDFAPPYSVSMKFPGCVSGSYQMHSLGGSVSATANVMSSGSISAKVYDAKGRVGYVRKVVTVEIPEKTEEELIPMEEPPSWLEEVAEATWEGLEDAGETLGEVATSTNQVMQAIGEAEQTHGYLRNLQSQLNKPKINNKPSNTNYYNKFKPPTPNWMKPGYKPPVYHQKRVPPQKKEKQGPRNYYVIITLHRANGKVSVTSSKIEQRNSKPKVLWSSPVAGKKNAYHSRTTVYGPYTKSSAEWTKKDLLSKPSILGKGLLHGTNYWGKQ